jgi:hypothetical protein
MTHAQPTSPSPDRPSLPEPVTRYLAEAVPEGRPWPRRVRLEQRGHLRLSPTAPWKPFTASQRFEAERTFFDWQAQVRFLGPLEMSVADRYEEGHGALVAKLLRIPVVRAAGPDLDEGELMRYLAELPWNPGAMALNPALTWSQPDERTLEVRCREGAVDATVQLQLDEEGDVVSAHANRPRSVGKRSERTPWGGAFSSYRRIGDIRIPTEVEVWWDLPEGRFRWFRGEVTGYEVDDGGGRDK